MDHYFLLIYKEVPVIDEQLLFIRYLNSLLASEEEQNYCLSAAPHLCPLLHKTSIYVAVIQPLNCEDSEICSWIKVNDVVTCDNVFQKFDHEWSNDSSVKVLPVQESQYISDGIHWLAEQLPLCGTYHFDVLISWNVLIETDLRQHLDFAGALHRLQTWHGAGSSIFLGEKAKTGFVLSWCDVTGAQLIKTNADCGHSSLLWRGDLRLGSPEASNSVLLNGWELKLDCHQEAIDHSLLMKICGIETRSSQCNDFIISSSHMDILDKCNISSIPAYMLCPIALKLCLTHEIDDSKEFLNSVNSNSGVGLIVKLSYCKAKELPSCDNSYSAQKWKKAVFSGNVHCPESILPADTEQITLVVTKSDEKNSSKLIAYPLLDSNDLKVDFCHSLLTSGSSFHYPFQEIQERCEKALSDIPSLQFSSGANYIKTFKTMQVKVLQDWLAHKKENNPNNECQASEEELKFIFSKVAHILHSKYHCCLQNPVPISEERKPLTINDIDPSDWPERVYLLHQQIQADKNKKYCSSDTLGGLAPPVIQKNAIVVAAKDIGKYFKQSGEAKNLNTDEIEILVAQNKCRYVHYSMEQILDAKWPAIAYCKYQDIYYNNDTECEEEESRNDKIKDRYVIYQTASTCSNQQLAPNYTILPTKNRDHARSATPNSKAKKKKRNPNDQFNKHYQKLRVIQSDDVFSPTIKNAKFPNLLSNSDHVFRKRISSSVLSSTKSSSEPLRRSPRKHIPVLRKPHLRQNKNGAKTKYTATKVDELSERHKMKLREAVAFALEKYDITLNHTSFKPCGRKLFAVCKAFVKDVIGKGSTSAQMRKIAAAHAKQVVEFEMQKNS